MSQSLAMVATEFLERPCLAKNTVQSYESALLPLLSEYGRMPIELLDRQTLQTYFNGINHVTYTTHHRHQAIIHALFTFAVAQDYIPNNPIAQLQRRKPDQARGEHHSDEIIRYLTPVQLQQMYRILKRDTRMFALVHLLHSTGARISELLALDLEDLDQENLKFQVVGKGNKRRWCFYHDAAADALHRYCRYSRHSGVPALFTAQHRVSKAVSRLSYRTAYEHWKKATQNHESLAGTRLHDLRHTFATERVGLINLEELRALMGHENIKTTLKYQKVTSQQAAKAAQKAFSQLNY